jgi:hypothetical protein
MRIVFGEAPNTAGEGARAPPKSKHFSGYSFHENALIGWGSRFLARHTTKKDAQFALTVRDY